MKGSEVSPGRFLQYQVVESKVGNGSLKPGVLLLQLLQLPDLVKIESAVLSAPLVVGAITDCPRSP